jgi:N-acetyl-1-D-myo-inositol-2-amino-2-deoxy-alpha-D-glucopyranoside deacetylase
MPVSVLKAGVEALAGSTDNPFEGITEVSEFPFGTPDEEVAVCVDASDFHEAKTAALRAHASQIPDTSWLYAIAGNFGAEFMGLEHYTLAVGERTRGSGPYGWESDLFAGLQV